MTSEVSNLVEEASFDIISGVSENITECILSKLPIPDAARTSLLSWAWRYKWVSLPTLIFDDFAFASVSCLRNVTPNNQTTYVREIINAVLLQHDAPIMAFTLSVTYMDSCKGIDLWITYLSSKGIKDFTLELWCPQRYKLHSKLFSVQTLRSLKLRHCIVKLPSIFWRLDYLTRLELSSVIIATEDLRNLTAKCSLLAHLKLHAVEGLVCVNIVALNLKTFEYFGDFRRFHLNSSLLESLSIRFSQLPDANVYRGGVSLIYTPNLLAGVRVLKVEKYFLKVLGACNQISSQFRVQFSLENLCYLDISNLAFEDTDMVSCLLWLITSLPKLEKVIVNLCTNSSAKMEHAMELLERESTSFCNLKLTHVEIKGVSGVRPEVELIKLILANSPQLKTMVVEGNKSDAFYNGEETLKKLVCFCRASTSAQIIYSSNLKTQ